MFQPAKESLAMNKRGFIILLASVPLWVTNVFLWHEHKEYIETIVPLWGPDVYPERFLFNPANIACILVTLVAFGFLLFDFVRWVRVRNHPKAQSN